MTEKPLADLLFPEEPEFMSAEPALGATAYEQREDHKCMDKQTVRCKFTCTNVTKRLHWDGSGRHLYDAEFSAVHDGSEENERFFEATPSGQLKIGTFKQDHFEVGKDYYLDVIEL